MYENNNHDLSEYRYIRLPEVPELIPIGKSTWYKWISCGIAPQPTKLSIRVVAWKIQDIKNMLIEMGHPDWQKKIKNQLK